MSTFGSGLSRIGRHSDLASPICCFRSYSLGNGGTTGHRKRKFLTRAAEGSLFLEGWGGLWLNWFISIFNSALLAMGDVG